MYFNNKVILIVGASTGIGRAVALKLAAAGAKLVITARSQDKLNSLEKEVLAKGSQCLAIAADALIEQDAAAVVRAGVERFGRIDIALLNAGGAPALDMRSMTAADVNYYMRTNYDVTVNYLFPVLAQMKQQNAGLVAHTNSLAGFLGVPLQGPYSAAKSATRLLIDTCRLEFAEFNIKFANIYPGFVATETSRNDGLNTPNEISIEQAAEHIIYALRKEKANYMFPLKMRWLIRLALLLPQPVLNWFLKRDVPPLKIKGKH